MQKGMLYLWRMCTGVSWRPGGACLVWIEEALRSLDRDLQQRYGKGAGILFRRGAYLNELQAVASATGSGAVYYNRRWASAISNILVSSGNL